VTVCSTNSTSVSRRSSRAAAATRSRHSSITSALLRQQCSGPRQSTDTAASFGGASSNIRPSSRHRYSNYDVPGIEISRIDTLDFDDGSLLATCSGKHGYGSGAKQSYVLLNRSASCVSLLFLSWNSISVHAARRLVDMLSWHL